MSEPLCNILTPEERQAAIDWAITQEQKAYARRNASRMISESDLLQKISSQYWTKKIDVEKVVADANQRKHWAMEDQKERDEREQKRREDLQKLAATHTVNFFYNMIKAYFLDNYGKFFIDDNNRHFIKAICLFFSNDARFETEMGYNPNKGLLIVGSAGLGKTKTIEAISRNMLNPVRIYSMIDISEEVREYGSAEVFTGRTILLDDVGSEQEIVNHYGTKINWFKEFIESYYLHNKTFNRILITTNCGGEELQTKYGIRVRSRMREMFNVIELKGTDLRK